MRLPALASAAALACCLLPTFSLAQGGAAAQPERTQDLREEIRRVVREEIRAALRELRADQKQLQGTRVSESIPAPKTLQLQLETEMKELDEVLKEVEVEVQRVEKDMAKASGARRATAILVPTAKQEPQPKQGKQPKQDKPKAAKAGQRVVLRSAQEKAKAPKAAAGQGCCCCCCCCGEGAGKAGQKSAAETTPQRVFELRSLFDNDSRFQQQVHPVLLKHLEDHLQTTPRVYVHRGSQLPGQGVKVQVEVDDEEGEEQEGGCCEEQEGGARKVAPKPPVPPAPPKAPPAKVRNRLVGKLLMV